MNRDLQQPAIGLETTNIKWGGEGEIIPNKIICEISKFVNVQIYAIEYQYLRKIKQFLRILLKKILLHSKQFYSWLVTKGKSHLASTPSNIIIVNIFSLTPPL